MRDPGQLWKRLCPHLLHDCRSMIFHGALAESEVGGDVLAWMAGKDEVHHLALADSETVDTGRCILTGGIAQPKVMGLIDCTFDTGEQFDPANGLFDEVARAR